jgi:membrane protein YdbS with pleckstrin-like domain
MNTFDDDIRGAMQTDDASLRSAGDEGLVQQMTATFRSRMRVWVLTTWLATLFWACVAVWAAVAFFRAQDTRNWIMYACIFLFAGMAIAMLKLWYLMEMNRNTHTREIKRVEIQLARLAEQMEK